MTPVTLPFPFLILCSLIFLLRFFQLAPRSRGRLKLYPPSSPNASSLYDREALSAPGRIIGDEATRPPVMQFHAIRDPGIQHRWPRRAKYSCQCSMSRRLFYSVLVISLFQVNSYYSGMLFSSVVKTAAAVRPSALARRYCHCRISLRREVRRAYFLSLLLRRAGEGHHLCALSAARCARQRCP